MNHPEHGQPLTPGPTVTVKEAAYPCPTCGAGLVHLHGYAGYHCKTCEPHLKWGPTVSETNGNKNGRGPIRIGRNRGMREFVIGEGETEKVIRLDVIKTHNEWVFIDQSIRVDGVVPLDRQEEYEQSVMRFARDHLQEPEIDQCGAWEFVARLTEEVVALQDFFTPVLPEKPDSRASSTTIVTCE